MLYRSLGARSFAEFWHYWNPVWGYALGKYVFIPLKIIFPPVMALIITFVISGLLHDFVVMGLRGSVTFIFVPWFFILGLGVILARLTEMDLSKFPWIIRACINILYVVTCYALSLLLKQIITLP